jgi:hypothetical protein
VWAVAVSCVGCSGQLCGLFRSAVWAVLFTECEAVESQTFSTYELLIAYDPKTDFMIPHITFLAPDPATLLHEVYRTVLETTEFIGRLFIAVFVAD